MCMHPVGDVVVRLKVLNRGTTVIFTLKSFRGLLGTFHYPYRSNGHRRLPW